MKPRKKKDSPTPKTASLLSAMNLDTFTIHDALKLLSLSRTLGTDSETIEEITVQNGRYGPYLKRGADSLTLISENKLFQSILMKRSRFTNNQRFITVMLLSLH